LSNRYITDRFLPDKAIDIINEAGARVKLRTPSTSTETDSLYRRIRGMDIRIENILAAQEYDKSETHRIADAMLPEKLEIFREHCDIKPSPTLR